MDYLVELRRELDAFGAVLDGDLSAPIEHCGGWRLMDLAVHMGAGNLWVVAAVRDGHGDGYDEGAAPRDRAGLKAWYAKTAEALVQALSVDAATEAWTFSPPHTVGSWRRRRSQETLMHRWDAEHALGSTKPMDALLATDGVAEVFDTMAPRMISKGGRHLSRAGRTDHRHRLWPLLDLRDRGADRGGLGNRRRPAADVVGPQASGYWIGDLGWGP
ncbi:maleylpyruvate isomerase family mycothiol-dependent enzyme [Actinomadura sp. OS1-43]|nr:maleylpyruvate isomerase family mycothiol-dependent enzyme [Actinomadura sp. OS1-43]MDL4817274.1 maleylpyruvate isomerase family mycothiol-dependent enzyme [Actinomadura sp. OS1-43]